MTRSIYEQAKSSQSSFSKDRILNKIMDRKSDLQIQTGKVKSQFNFEVIKGSNQKYEHMNLNKLA